MDIRELLQKRANLWEQAKDIHEQAKKEKRGLHADEEERFNALDTEINGLTKTIEREQRMQEEAARMEASLHGNQRPAEQGGEQRAVANPLQTEEYRSAFNKFLTLGMGELNTEERNILNKGRATTEARALSSVTGPAGGYTVPQGFYNSLIESMKAFGGMRSVRSTILRTAEGNTLPIPKVDDTTNVGAIVGENTNAGNATDPVFSQLNLSAYKYTSKVFLIPIELLQDSAFDIESYIRNVIQTRIGRITNQHFTTGTGSSQPSGVVTGSTLGKLGATGQTTSVTYDDLIDLIHSVDPAYRVAGSEFMFNDSTLKALRKLKDTSGLPIWQPGLVQGEPDRILGFKYTINQDVASMAASAKSILFGDFSKFFIRDVMDLSIYRMGEKYIDAGQVGFVAFSRHDSVLVDSAAIKHYTNSAT